MVLKKSSKKIDRIKVHACLLIVIGLILGVYEVIDYFLTGDTYRVSLRITSYGLGLCTAVLVLFYFLKVKDDYS